MWKRRKRLTANDTNFWLSEKSFSLRVSRSPTQRWNPHFPIFFLYFVSFWSWRIMNGANQMSRISSFKASAGWMFSERHPVRRAERTNTQERWSRGVVETHLLLIPCWTQISLYKVDIGRCVLINWQLQDSLTKLPTISNRSMICVPF